LQGPEAAAGVRYEAPNRTHRTSPVLVRYADDFVVLRTSQEQVEQVQCDRPPWLQARGLSLNPDKTRGVHLAQGYDFLGFPVRRYGTKLLIKPSPAALHRHQQHLRAELHGLRGRNVPQVIQRLNPLIRGWTNYYRTVVSSAAFASLDRHLWQGLYNWGSQLNGHPGFTEYVHPGSASPTHWSDGLQLPDLSDLYDRVYIYSALKNWNVLLDEEDQGAQTWLVPVSDL